jgi:uncharacterized protein YjdB
MPEATIRTALVCLLALLTAACSDSGTRPSDDPAVIEVSAPAQSVPVYGELQLAAAVKTADGRLLQGQAVTWASTTPETALVTSSGRVTAVAAGQASIVATSQGRTGSIVLTVTPAPVATVTLSPAAATTAQGGALLLDAAVRDERGSAVTGRDIAWSSSNPTVATVASTGHVQGVRGGEAVITATVEGRSGRAAVTVTDTVATVTISPSQMSLQVGQAGEFAALALSDAGAPLAGRAVLWSSNAPALVTISPSGAATAHAHGSAVISATVEGRSASAIVTIAPKGGPGDTPAPALPAIAGVTPAVLVPGATATITASGLATSGNAVTIGGITAPVTATAANQLQVTVPCVPSGSALPVVLTVNGVASQPFSHALAVAGRHTLAVGESVLIGDAAGMACNELAGGPGQQRFVLAVYNSTVSATAASDYRIAGAGGAAVAAPSHVAGSLAAAAAAAVHDSHAPGVHAPPPAHAGPAHHELLEKNRLAYESLWRQYGEEMKRAERMQPLANLAMNEPPLNTTIRVSNINSGSICTNFYTIQATRVYYAGKLAIYEDDATPVALKAANNPTMASYYRQIGEQYNDDMEPILRTYFGDPIRRDAVTDRDGVLRAVFTPVINNNIPGIAGFVVSCDQFPNASNNTASNFGEYFYAYQPTNANSGYTTGTPDQWFRQIRSTFIHEAKHVASHAARVANNASSYEVSWLEEGTARHAEELWSRMAVYSVPWKGNTGYGSAAAPGSVYCDVRPSVAACNAANPRRPSSSMWNHFVTLYSFLGNPGGLSPFGRSAQDNSSVFYASSWSLLRYIADQYTHDEAAFFTALNQATNSGASNLAARTGLTMAELLGRWALALYADDMPGLTGRPELQVATWNLPGVYAGAKADFPGTFTRATPLVTTPLSFGTFAALQRSALVGGGVDYFEITGTNAAGQAIILQSLSGGAPAGALRMAILRVQ